MNQKKSNRQGWGGGKNSRPRARTKQEKNLFPPPLQHKQQDGSLPYFGVVVGRVANRISGAAFSLPDGTEVKLPANDNGRHCLHGGTVGWDKREWSDEGEGGGAPLPQQQQPSSSAAAAAASEPGAQRPPRRSSALLSLLSEDGDQGFPGNVRARVLYELLPGGNALR